MTIYEAVKAKGKEKGRSITSIESDLHFARGSLYKWRESPPGIKKVQAVAELLGCTVDELLVGVEWHDDISA